MEENNFFFLKVVLVGRPEEIMTNSSPYGTEIKIIKTGRLRLPRRFAAFL